VLDWHAGKVVEYANIHGFQDAGRARARSVGASVCRRLPPVVFPRLNYSRLGHKYGYVHYKASTRPYWLDQTSRCLSRLHITSRFRWSKNDCQSYSSVVAFCLLLQRRKHYNLEFRLGQAAKCKPKHRRNRDGLERAHSCNRCTRMGSLWVSKNNPTRRFQSVLLLEDKQYWSGRRE